MAHRVILRSLCVVIAAATVAWVALRLHPDEETTAADAELVALGWVGAGVAQEPRRDGDTWEVDIVRDDGSMVQVRLGPKLQLRDFDEEFGPAGAPAHDELKGAARARAVRAAFEEIDPGRVVSVERDSARHMEVGIRRPDGTQVEVELNHRFEVLEVVPEDPRDE
jgi:hypothetical protein